MHFKDLIDINEPSVLSSEKIVAWKKQEGSYNFSSLPEIAIIALKSSVFSKKTRFFSKKIKGINGVHFIYKSSVLLCSEFGSGSPALILLLEELKSLGVRKFIFVGLAGIFDNKIEEGDACIISSVQSLTGSSFYYSVKEEIEVKNQNWLKEISSFLQLPLNRSIAVDAPFRETQSIVRFSKARKLSFIEMETGGLYAFGEYYNLSCLSILLGADRINEESWQHPKNISFVIERQKIIIKELIKFFT